MKSSISNLTFGGTQLEQVRFEVLSQRCVYLPRLNWGYICSNDLRLGKLVTKVHSPDSGAGTDVKYFLWGLNRRKVKLAIHNQGGSVVDDIKSLRGLVVIRRPVLSIASLGMVRSAVDGAVLKDARVDGRGRAGGIVA